MSVSISRFRLAGIATAFAFLSIFGLVAARDGRAADRIYWASFTSGTIQWANLDGSGGIHELNPGAATVGEKGYGVGGEVDPVEGRYYWINQEDEKLLWANLDGSGGGDLGIGAATIDHSSYGLSIDPAARRIYWGTNGSIEFAKLDGSGGGKLDVGLATSISPYATVVYPAAGRVYWANGGLMASSLAFASLEGGGGQNLKLTGTGPIEYPFGIAIDAAAQRIYWSNDTAEGSISVANLDGTNSAEIPKRGLDLGGGNYGIALDPEAGRVYTAEFADDELAFLNTNGTGGATVPVDMPENSGPNFPVLYKEPKATSAPTLTAKAPRVATIKRHKKGMKRSPSPLPRLIGSTLFCTGGTFAGDLVEAHLYRRPVRIDHAITRDGQTVSGFATGLGPEPAVLRLPPTATAPGNYRCQISGTNVAGTATVTSAPTAIFKTGKLKRNLKKGTAKLAVELPAEAGTLTLATKGLKAVSRSASGKTTVLLKPKGAKKAKLASSGKLKAIAKLTYTPPGGAPATLRTRVTLKQR